MIILDANVVSEAMKPSPRPEVMSWLSGQSPSAVWITAITVAEILYGIAKLPEGRRRAALRSKFDALLERGFTGRVLAFDQAAAEAYAAIMSTRRTLGRSMSVPDGQIAAIATTQGARIATRDVEDFDGCGLAIVNPWAS